MIGTVLGGYRLQKRLRAGAALLARGGRDRKGTQWLQDEFSQCMRLATQ